MMMITVTVNFVCIMVLFLMVAPPTHSPAFSPRHKSSKNQFYACFNFLRIHRRNEIRRRGRGKGQGRVKEEENRPFNCLFESKEKKTRNNQPKTSSKPFIRYPPISTSNINITIIIINQSISQIHPSPSSISSCLVLIRSPNQLFHILHNFLFPAQISSFFQPSLLFPSYIHICFPGPSPPQFAITRHSGLQEPRKQEKQNKRIKRKRAEEEEDRKKVRLKSETKRKGRKEKKRMGMF